MFEYIRALKYSIRFLVTFVGRVNREMRMVGKLNQPFSCNILFFFFYILATWSDQFHNQSICNWYVIQIVYLENWSALEAEHSTSLSGTIEALKASTLRLPVTGRTRVCKYSKNPIFQSMHSCMKVGNLTVFERYNWLVPKISLCLCSLFGRRTCVL